MSYAIAIDGPAGAGKSTIAKRIAKELKFVYVDTGAMYRAMALYMIRQGILPEETEKVSKACENADITIEYIDETQVVFLNGENVNALIRTEEVGNMASMISANKEVRLKLVELQRKLAKKKSVVMDGRDICTYVLPDANLKIYLTASVETRAKRRYTELVEKGVECDLTQIENDIRDRDYRDMNRDIAPLKQAADATLVDSSELSIDETSGKIIQMYRENINGN